MNRRVFGITGPIASGKSRALAEWRRIFSARGLGLATVDVDETRRRILYHSTEERHLDLRRRLAATLAIDPAGPAGWNGTVLGEAIFADPAKMSRYRELVNPAIREALGEALERLSGWVALEWALLEEDGLADLCDGPIVMLDCDPAVQQRRLAGSDLPAGQLARRIAYQRELQDNPTKRAGRKYIRLDTSHDPSADVYERIYEEIVADQNR